MLLGVRPGLGDQLVRGGHGCGLHAVGRTGTVLAAAAAGKPQIAGCVAARRSAPLPGSNSKTSDRHGVTREPGAVRRPSDNQAVTLRRYLLVRTAGPQRWCRLCHDHILRRCGSQATWPAIPGTAASSGTRSPARWTSCPRRRRRAEHMNVNSLVWHASSVALALLLVTVALRAVMPSCSRCSPSAGATPAKAQSSSAPCCPSGRGSTSPFTSASGPACFTPPAAPRWSQRDRPLPRPVQIDHPPVGRRGTDHLLRRGLRADRAARAGPVRAQEVPPEGRGG